MEQVSFSEGTPLYLQVARHIQRQIGNGAYPVGSLLPPETELAGQLGVSRQTVRQAIAQLRQRNMLSARKGIGTRVEAPADDWRRRFTANSRGDLFDFARETELRFEAREQIEARGALAVEMGVRPGRKFLYARGPRSYPGEEKPLCYNEVYLDLRLKSLLAGVEVLRAALFIMVENETGERVREIRQEVRATGMPAHAARHLGREEGALCLRITRRYVGSDGRLLEYAVQHYPGESFSYQTTLSSS